MGFAAVNTGNNLLFLVVSSLLGFMAVSGLAGWLNIRALGVTIHFPDEIYDGSDTLLTVRLRNGKRLLPSFLLRVHVFETEVRFHLVERKASETEAVTIRLQGRGKRVLEAVHVSSVFPINFFVRKRSVRLHSVFTVFPAPFPCPRAGGDEGRESRGDTSSSRTGYGGELLKIHNYTGYEPIKLIHWRLSARHDELMVKVLSAPSQTPLVLDVHSLPGRNLEERLSSGAFLINGLMRAGRPVGLRLGRTLISPDSTRAHRLRMLGELAEYGQS